MLIDLLYGTTLTCYWSSPWQNCNLESRKNFETLLINQLKGRTNVEDDIMSVDWMVGESASSKACLILLRGRAVYRIFCFFSKDRVLLLTSCAAMICAQALDCLSITFDCTIRLLSIPGNALQHLFSIYLKGLLERNEPIGASQMVFESNEPGRPLVTLALPEDQLEALRQADGHRDLIDRVYEHMKKSTAVCFEKLPLIRVNCSGFTMTSNGKIRLFKRLSRDEVQRIISVLAIGCHTQGM